MIISFKLSIVASSYIPIKLGIAKKNETKELNAKRVMHMLIYIYIYIYMRSAIITLSNGEGGHAFM